MRCKLKPKEILYFLPIIFALVLWVVYPQRIFAISNSSTVTIKGIVPGCDDGVIQSDGSCKSSTSISSSLLTSTPTPTPAITQPPASFIPFFLRFFDVDGDGIIESSELSVALGIWVDRWKSFLVGITSGETLIDLSKCDLNNDGECNVIDFSILLYYIGR